MASKTKCVACGKMLTAYESGTYDGFCDSCFDLFSIYQDQNDMYISWIAKEIHALAHSNGFYVGKCFSRKPCKHRSGVRPGALMLIVSELAEALEADRKNDERGYAEEIADAIIRLLDLCAAEKIDIETAIARKMVINAHRQKRHGKKY